ncbi:MAG: hypothetical protein HS115_08130 [Spirochaetales bacterium]|nr:hypothetical protein [Spirochaetales bacterium]
MTELPGEEFISKGLADLESGQETIESLLLEIGAPRLNRLGFAIQSKAGTDHPESRLYWLLTRFHGDDAHARYNSLIRRLVSYERALELSQTGLEGATSVRPPREAALGGNFGADGT